MKSLFFGAMALALVAGAAVAGQAYQDGTSQPVKTADTSTLLSRSAVNVSQKTVDPAIFDPSRSTPFHSEANSAANIQTVSKNTLDETRCRLRA